MICFIGAGLGDCPGILFILRAAVNYCVIQPVQKLHKLPGTAKTERKHYDDLEECHGQKGRISD